MEWRKTTITTTDQGAEIITGLLLDLGVSGVEIIDKKERSDFFANGSSQWDYVDELLQTQAGECENSVSIVFYLGADNESESLLKGIKMGIEYIKSCASDIELLGSLSLSTETVNDQDWLHEWKKHFQPIRIGIVLIVPEWDKDAHESDIIFTIDPGSAFGTGQHATTMLCVEALQKHMKPKNMVLDVGCGSGILSIISLLLGAKQAVGCDIDPAAVEVTRKNAGLNPVDASALKLYVGDILTCTELQASINHFKFDIVVANIVADTIINLSPIISNILKPRGVFIASGIIIERLEDVIATLTFNDFEIIDIKISEGWCCVVANG